jgi:tetratricopeptide (TPR) repeat protein
MKSIFKPYIIMLFLLLAQMPAFAQELAANMDLPLSDSRALGASVTDYLVTAESGKSTRTLADMYKKGIVREKLGAYENALSAYDGVIARATEILNARETTPALAMDVLPYAIASAYRKGILTHRAVEGSVMKLYRQLEMYQDADSWINEVLTSISNLTTEKGMSITPVQYYPLYYARAYNRVGWAYALLNGSAWKRYIIYTPADTITMIDKSMGDLGSAFSAFDVDYSKDGRNQGYIESRVDETLKNVNYKSREYTTFALCFNVYGLSEIKGIIRKQVSNSFRLTLDAYYSDSVIAAFTAGRKIFTYEEFMKAETKDVIAAMAKILEQMK